MEWQVISLSVHRYATYKIIIDVNPVNVPFGMAIILLSLRALPNKQLLFYKQLMNKYMFNYCTSALRQMIISDWHL